MKRGELIYKLEGIAAHAGVTVGAIRSLIEALKVGNKSGQESGQESGLTAPLNKSLSSIESSIESSKEESKKEDLIKGSCLPTAEPNPPTTTSPTPLLADRGPRGSRLPADWEVGPTFLEYARRQGLSEPDARHEAAKFKSYWLGVSGKQAIKLDWLQVWQNWILNALGKYGIKPSGPSGGQEVTLSEERRAELAAKYGKRA